MQAADASLDLVYAALADSTRRTIVSMLAHGDATVGTIAARFPMSLNGVSKHLKVLERAGVLERTIEGREHRLRLAPGRLDDAARWLDHYRRFWESRLDALEGLLVQQHGPQTATRPTTRRTARKRR
jgi:DNA-binding transcriptional ArsR family regulator